MSSGMDHKRYANDDAGAVNLPATPGLSRDTYVVGAKSVRQVDALSWAKENAGAIAERRAWIEIRGTPLSHVQVLPID